MTRGVPLRTHDTTVPGATVEPAEVHPAVEPTVIESPRSRKRRTPSVLHGDWSQ